MEKKHTPGPWTVGYASPESQAKSTLAVWQQKVLDSGFGSVICKVSPESKMSEEDQANATLIAAAPDMLEALQEALTMIPEVFTVYSKIEKAIAKATGEKEVQP